MTFQRAVAGFALNPFELSNIAVAELPETPRLIEACAVTANALWVVALLFFDQGFPSPSMTCKAPLGDLFAVAASTIS